MNVRTIAVSVLTLLPLAFFPWPREWRGPVGVNQVASSSRYFAAPENAEKSPIASAFQSLLSAPVLDAEKFKNVLRNKTNLNVHFPDDGATPLTIAVQYWPSSVVDALLNAGADPNFRDVQGLTPLAYVALGDCGQAGAQSAKALLAHGASVTEFLDFTRVYRDAYYELPFEVWRDTRARKISLLETAFFHNKGEACVVLLLENGATIDRHVYSLWKETRQDLRSLALQRPLF